MTPEYYANLCRRYSTYSRNYGDNQLYKIACGPNRTNYNWTEVVMRECTPKPGQMRRRPIFNGLSLHCYVSYRQSATEFDEEGWFIIQKGANYYDYEIGMNAAIMDKYDPKKTIGMVMDEWGTWFAVEPGTNPGFLYQQSTQRDAVLTGTSFNIMHKYADRLQMANIAQTINVLQAVALTEGKRMLLTPTYHVFNMYKEHQGAEVVETTVEGDAYKYGIESIPAVTASASVKDGKLLLTLSNAHYSQDAEVSVSLDYEGEVSGTILATPAPNTFNTFDEPEKVKPAPFTGFARREGGLTVSMPAYSVIALSIG